MSRFVTTHGRCRTPEYRVWTGIRTRCRNKNDHNYARYGARGIRICERWDSFKSFFADMGQRPSPKHQIERIDNDVDYEPRNCRWATKTEQMRNTRATKFSIDLAREARARRAAGESCSSIASAMHVSRRLIKLVEQGKVWQET